MVDDNDHGACVEAWMERAAKGLPPARMLQAFERGFAALWRRAHRTLGDVTLAAILNRVLFNAAQQHPILSALELGATGLQCQALRERAESLRDDELAEGIRFVLVELLTILGNLTADILTPSLHAELSNGAREVSGLPEQMSSGEPGNPENTDGEDAKR